MLVDDLLGAIAFDGLRPEVPAGDIAVHVQNVDGVVADVLHHHAEPLLARAHLLFGELPFGDVLADADDPHRPARIVAVHASLVVHRPADPVRPHDAKLVFILGTAPQPLVRYLSRALPFLRITIPAKPPHSPRHRDDMRDTAVRIEHGAAMALDPAYLSAREEKPNLHVPVLTVADGIEERLLDLFLVLGMNPPKRIGPYEILAVSEQPAVGGIHVNPLALRVDQEDQVGSALGDHAEAFFGFAQIFRH